MRSVRGAWVCSNPRVHRHVQVDAAAMQALMVLGSGASRSQWERALGDAAVSPRTTFTNANGLLADPSGLAPEPGPALSGAAAMDALLSAWAICLSDSRDYDDFVQFQTSLLDSTHLGTFHQNVGRHLLLDRRIKETWRWWHDQKFTPDGLGVRPGPYEWVQRYFFDRYFGAVDLSNKRLLDFACGNGFYSRKFHDRGADVVGIDTSGELIAIARRNHGDRIEFMQPPDAAESNAMLDSLPAGSFDMIYVSDALLFFFHDPKTGSADETPALELLRRLRRLLGRDGVLYLMEPNGTFWLTTHGGQPPRPIALVTEYHDRVYHVAPTMDKVISALGRSGFCVRDLIHPRADAAANVAGDEMHAYATAFPLWDFFVCPAAAI